MRGMQDNLYDWYRGPPRSDLTALRYAANQNLVRLGNGEVKREQQADAARKRAERASNELLRRLDREEKAELRARVKAINKELDETRQWWEQLGDAHTAGTISQTDYAIYEELDAQRNALLEELDPLLRRQYAREYAR